MKYGGNGSKLVIAVTAIALLSVGASHIERSDWCARYPGTCGLVPLSHLRVLIHEGILFVFFAALIVLGSWVARTAHAPPGVVRLEAIAWYLLYGMAILVLAWRSWHLLIADPF